jgi:hypothetical protein
MKLKAVVTIYSFVIYIVISMSLIAIVYTAATNITTKQQENFNFESMIDTIKIIDSEIKTIAQNIEAKSQIIVHNPEELEINCFDNFIYGRILYEQNFRDDEVVIQDINISKKHNALEFVLDYDNVILTCNNDQEINGIFLNKGKNTINIEYKEYDTSNQKVIINISQYDIEHESS